MAKFSARIKLSAARRTPIQTEPNWPWRALRRLPKVKDTSPARLRSPNNMGGSLSPGKRGTTCVLVGINFTVLMERLTLLGLVPLGIGEELGAQVDVACG